MWIIIIGVVFLILVAGMFYLGQSFGRFGLIRKIAHERKYLDFLFGLLVTVLIGGAITVFIGVFNAVIALIHLAVFFLIFNLIFKIPKLKKLNSRIYLSGWLAIAGTIIYLGYGWIMANTVSVTPYTISTDKDIHPTRIVAITDAHIGATFDSDVFLKEIEKVNSLNPDLVVLVGDYVDDMTSEENMVKSCEALGTVKSTYGVCYVNGNHDKSYHGNGLSRGEGYEKMLGCLRENGVRILVDEEYPLSNSGVTVIGREDKSAGSGRLQMTDFEPLDPERFYVVLDHQPGDYEAEARSGVDLVISGHTHGGQFIPTTYVGEWFGINDATYGLSRIGNTDFIVSSGISDWQMRFKTGCRSEIVLIDIEGEK